MTCQRSHCWYSGRGYGDLRPKGKGEQGLGDGGGKLVKKEHVYQIGRCSKCLGKKVSSLLFLFLALSFLVCKMGVISGQSDSHLMFNSSEEGARAFQIMRRGTDIGSCGLDCLLDPGWPQLGR